MSTTVSYKGSTLTTISNETKKLDTAGTWLEDDITITDEPSGGSVLVVDTPDSHGGTIREITAQNVVTLQGQKQITPSTTTQTIEPDTGYDGFESVVVSPAYTIDEVLCGTGLVGDIVFTGTTLSSSLAYQTEMTSFTADNVTSMPHQGDYPMFRGCTKLANISMANASYFYNSSYNFAGCTSLTSITSANFPNASTFYCSNAFRGCTGLTLFCLPKLGTASVNYLAGSTFYGCTSLATIDLATIGRIVGNNFYGCSSLSTLILRKTSVVINDNTSSFTNTPFASGGTGGTIYIPKALYDHLGDGTSSDYKAASNWSVIDGYGTITWAKIEGSYYETHYADGTTIPTT